ncbi:MAG TPA: hypothetical protein PK555_08415 [Steroidobacteraceae bacterium]|nr:hypothetical protein [Steroidobacteraceae bacterium]
MSLRRALTVLAALAFAACTHTGVATEVPDLQDMRLAPAGEKIGAPVEVRYAIQGTVARGTSTPVALAIVPRAPGRLQVEFPATGNVAVSVDKAPLVVEKAAASVAYRYALHATPQGADSGMLKVIVTMEFGDARYFSVFNIPLGAATE